MTVGASRMIGQPLFSIQENRWSKETHNDNIDRVKVQGDHKNEEMEG